MNTPPNGPRPSPTPTSADLADEFDPNDFFDADDSSSSSAGSEQPAPRMQQASEDVMQIDNDDDEGSRRDLKRKWTATTLAAASDDGGSPVSSEPRSKRQRAVSVERVSADDAWPSIAAPSPAAHLPHLPPQPPEPSLWYDVVRDADFIRLIRRHGGKESGAAQGASIELALPADLSLEFRVAHLCLQLACLNAKRDFPGKDDFLPVAFMQFVSHLEQASLADEAGLLRQLLDTGYPAPPELIDPLLAAAIEAGAQQAAELLRHAIHTPSGARAEEDRAESAARCATGAAHGSNSAAASAQAMPPPAWREQVEAHFDKDNLHDLLACFAPGGDQERGLALLFGPQDSRPAGQFNLRIVLAKTDDQQGLLKECGALVLSEEFSFTNVYLCAGDFDHGLLRARLLELQAQEAEDHNGFTELMFAVQWGDPEIVRALLDAGARPRLTEDGKTALHRAAQGDNLNIVEQLIAALAATQPPDVPLADALNALDDGFRSPLYLAAEDGRYKVCALLLDKGALPTPAHAGANDDANDDSDDGARPQPKQPLVIAATKGDAAICTLLLRRGADVNVRDKDQNTPLLKAAMWGHLEACKALLAHGADILAVNDDGHTALSLAATGGHPDVARVLLRQGARIDGTPGTQPPLLAAASAPQRVIEMLALLLDKGANVNQQSPYGWTALMQACRHGNAQAVELLLSRGADPNQTDMSKNCVLDYVIADYSIIELLIRHGTDLHSDGRGLKAMNCAIQSRKPAIVSLLLKHQVPTDPLAAGLSAADNPLLKIEFNTFDSKAEPLPEALTLLELLLKHGTPIHHANDIGNDVLMQATRCANLPCVAALLRHGARIGQVSTADKTALQMAMDHFEIDSDVSGFNARAAELFGMLLAQVRKQDNFITLWKDALQGARHPLARDMLLTSWNWSGVDAPAPARTIVPVNADLFNTFLQSLLAYLAADPKRAKRDPLLRQLALWGFTQPVVDLLLPFVDAYPTIKAALSGDRPELQTVYANQAINDWLASLESVLSLPPGTWRPYAKYQLNLSTEAVLTNYATGMLKIMADSAVDGEAIHLAPACAALFETCLEQTPQPWVVDGRLVTLQLPLHAITYRLMQASFYAPFAERIEAAWRSAWRATAEATEQASLQSASSASASSANSATPMDSSGDVYFGAYFDQNFDGLSTSVANFLPELPSSFDQMQTTEDFAGTPLAADLLKAFREALHVEIDSPGSDILKLPGSTLERRVDEEGALTMLSPTVHQDTQAQDIYAMLMARQLHMLTQFIKGGSQPTEAEASSGQG